MDSKIEKELISILMESPMYFILGLRERHDLIVRLMKMRLGNSQEISKVNKLSDS